MQRRISSGEGMRHVPQWAAQRINDPLLIWPTLTAPAGFHLSHKNQALVYPHLIPMMLLAKLGGINGIAIACSGGEITLNISNQLRHPEVRPTPLLHGLSTHAHDRIVVPIKELLLRQ